MVYYQSTKTEVYHTDTRFALILFCLHLLTVGKITAFISRYDVILNQSESKNISLLNYPSNPLFQYFPLTRVIKPRYIFAFLIEQGDSHCTG